MLTEWNRLYGTMLSERDDVRSIELINLVGACMHLQYLPRRRRNGLRRLGHFGWHR